MIQVSNFKCFIKYILKHKIVSGLLFYFISSLLLKSITSIDVLIPCIWKSLFNINCIGCGLTRASLKLLHFNFKEAYHSNPLIYIVLPSILFYIIKDYKSFKNSL